MSVSATFTFEVTFLKIASDSSCERTLSSTCGWVRPCAAICVLYFFSEPPKYCFLICLSRSWTCLSLISIPRSLLAFSSNSVRWTRYCMIWFCTATYCVVPGFGNLRFCCCQLFFVDSSIALNSSRLIFWSPTTATESDGTDWLSEPLPPPQAASPAAAASAARGRRKRRREEVMEKAPSRCPARLQDSIDKRHRLVEVLRP